MNLGLSHSRATLNYSQARAQLDFMDLLSIEPTVALRTCWQL